MPDDSGNSDRAATRTSPPPVIVPATATRIGGYLAERLRLPPLQLQPRLLLSLLLPSSDDELLLLLRRAMERSRILAQLPPLLADLRHRAGRPHILGTAEEADRRLGIAQRHRGPHRRHRGSETGREAGHERPGHAGAVERGRAPGAVVGIVDYIIFFQGGKKWASWQQ